MDAFVEAGVEAGHLRNPDFNGEKQDGVGLYQLTQRNGMRCSAAVAFLHPALGRSNLKVVTDAIATRILFDGRGQAASKSSATGSCIEPDRALRFT
jgi:choline dehydrogenase-like flavoprotein